MKNNKNAVLMAMALLSLPASAQVKIDSIAPHRYAAQSIDVGANVNFSREQSTSAVSVITSESTNKRSRAASPNVRFSFTFVRYWIKDT